MPRTPACMKVLLWIGVCLFLICFAASTIVPHDTLPALGLTEYNGFIIRLYGIFQLSWALLFFFALKDVEKNQAIINSAILTGIAVAVYFVVYQFASRKPGRYLLLNAALTLSYAALLYFCKRKFVRPKKSSFR